MEIRSERLTLRDLCESDRAAFAALNSAPDVTHDLGGPRIAAEATPNSIAT